MFPFVNLRLLSQQVWSQKRDQTRDKKLPLAHCARRFGVNAALVSLFPVVRTQHCPPTSLTVTLNYRFLLLSQLLNVATSIHFALWVAFRKDEIVAANRQNGPLVQAVTTEWAAQGCLRKCCSFNSSRRRLRLWRCLISLCCTTTQPVQPGKNWGLKSDWNHL